MWWSHAANHPPRESLAATAALTFVTKTPNAPASPADSACSASPLCRELPSAARRPNEGAPPPGLHREATRNFRFQHMHISSHRFGPAAQGAEPRVPQRSRAPPRCCACSGLPQPLAGFHHRGVRSPPPPPHLRGPQSQACIQTCPSRHLLWMRGTAPP